MKELRREYLDRLVMAKRKVGETIIGLLRKHDPRIAELEAILGDNIPKFSWSKTTSFILDDNFVEPDQLWPFIAERNSISHKKRAGLPRPWTDDKILHTVKINELDRKNDYGTKYLLNFINNRNDLELHDVIYICLLYRFSGSNTKLIESIKDLSIDTWQDNLEDKTIFLNSAYSGPSFPRGKGSGRYFMKNHLVNIACDVEEILRTHTNVSIKELVDLILPVYKNYKFEGNSYNKMVFHTNEIVKDLSYFIEAIDGDLMCDIGLGSKKVLTSMFKNNKHQENFQTLIEDKRYEELGLNPDILEHSICEFRKYSEYKQGKPIKKNNIYIPRESK